MGPTSATRPRMFHAAAAVAPGPVVNPGQPGGGSGSPKRWPPKWVCRTQDVHVDRVRDAPSRLLSLGV